MGCFIVFHNWSKWGSPIPFANSSALQKRECIWCGMVDTRRISDWPHDGWGARVAREIRNMALEAFKDNHGGENGTK